MEYILNELSLHGQYKDKDEFMKVGMSDICKILAHARKQKDSSILKRSDFYNNKVTANSSLYEILVSDGKARINDRIRRFKSQLSSLQTQPFWDGQQQRHSHDLDYYHHTDTQQTKVNGTALAEAYARDANLISFNMSNFEDSPIKVSCQEKPKDIPNICQIAQFLDALYDTDQISSKEYFKNRFNLKLDFTQISDKNGLNLINKSNKDAFISSFDNFENKTWQQIMIDDGLDYKEFSKNRNTRHFFSDAQWKAGVYKFRIDSEKRCFGHRIDDIFYIWRIDLDHKLSDLG